MSRPIHPFTNAKDTLGWIFTPGGTISHPDISRTRFTSAAVAGSSAGPRSAVPVCWRGSSPLLGGFHFSARFGQSTNVSGGRMFVGLGAPRASMVVVNPSRTANLAGVGFDATDPGDGTLQLFVNDGFGRASKVPLVIAPRNGTDLYDLEIHSEPNGSSLSVRFENLTTKKTVHIELTSDLPDPSALLYAHAEIGSGTTKTEAQLELVSMWIEREEPRTR